LELLLIVSLLLMLSLRPVSLSGDCVVAFSRRELYRLKRDIETLRGLKCCIVYGSLPPEVRRQQAELFNTAGNDFDVLVATVRDDLLR
jgi:superfamily II DNA/RNA helicase